SVAKDEYEECLTKAAFLTASKGQFDLFETLGWTPADGFHLLDRHLERLTHSATYFGFRFDENEIRTFLDQLVEDQSEARRIKLLLSRSGAISGQAQSMPPSPKQPVPIKLSAIQVNSADPFLYHKTTKRDVYTQAASDKDAFEHLLSNERGEITEGCFTNLFVQKHGQLYTPKLECGLLPGILRAELLAQGTYKEHTLYIDDLKNADALFIGNSLRGLLSAKLI
ncbi:MAG: aminotransferase class IV family protein, partial [Sphingomonadales bacterium]